MDLMRLALDQPAEFSAGRLFLMLGVTSLVAFIAAALIFDPEHRFVRPQSGTPIPR